MATIVHFDISAESPARAMEFYEKLFDWKFDSMPGFSDYYEIETRDLNGRPGAAGGLTKRTSPQQTGITNFIGVASIDETLVKLEKFGGKILQSKQAIPGYGYLAVCTDTESNIIGLFQETRPGT